MTRIAKHVLLPAVAPAAVIGLYFMPVSLVGCANRGLIALAVVFISLLAGIVIGLSAFRGRARGDAGSGWWALSVFILALPAALVLGPLR